MNMVASEMGSFANGFLFVANMLNTVTIDKLVVPDLVQAGNVAILDCQYTVLDDKFTLQWLFNGSEVYEWRPGTKPSVGGILDGRLDVDYKVSNGSNREHHPLRIVQATPELSGDYTCRIRHDSGANASITATMLVFSPESEFVLDVQHDGANNNTLNIRCIARGLYPQPDLTLEYNHSPVAQQQRVWRSGGLFSAETYTRLRARRGRAVCRLQLPLAGYAAMRSYVPDNETKNAPSDAPSRIYSSITLSVATVTIGRIFR
ncbi:uncharacterized protein LOC125233230 [Leguminivora glycinivorella]|uniref:uncharacterized protein LOC125233230 n=1 Tax=Leguminivora glycinivorella TaxID=1035111 RepID=UPI00200CFEE2|nr:uncharacterized protein LOC125233230 [Leguminivora glycinivorella]